MTTGARVDTPTSHTDPVNRRILAVSEDCVPGFHRHPFREIARRAGLDEKVVIDRVRAMLEAGTIRRVRQTLMTSSLAHGALVAWRLPARRIRPAFEFMARQDPFTGHVVVRSTRPENIGSDYRLWTTVKVPVGYSVQAHCRLLARRVGADRFVPMPARGIFKLGVGHVRRESVAPGDRANAPAPMLEPALVELDERQWRVLHSLKQELDPAEIRTAPWDLRARALGLSPEQYASIAAGLARRGVLGRFSTFLEHARPMPGAGPISRCNALMHWAVPPAQVRVAGGEVGRHHIVTHCYWRDAHREFGGVNIMAVAHGTARRPLREHKAAIDRHLAEAGVAVRYTNVFWGGRSEIKPSEFRADRYQEWLRQIGATDA